MAGLALGRMLPWPLPQVAFQEHGKVSRIVSDDSVANHYEEKVMKKIMCMASRMIPQLMMQLIISGGQTPCTQSLLDIWQWAV